MGTERVARDKTLVWSGEHWIAYLREPGEESDRGRVSLYHVRYSPTGEGIVAFVDIPHDDGISAVYADDPRVAQFVADTVVGADSNNPFFEHDLPVLDASMGRDGSVVESPSWKIESERGTVEVTWSTINTPLILEGPGPVRHGTAVTYSLLFFTDGASIMIDGVPTGGKPYLREIWRNAIGRPGNSTVFALAETTTTVGQA